MSLSRVLLSLATALLATPCLRAETFHVDDDGGPFADFTDIQSAVDAASPGDVIIVERGFYDGFVLTRGLTVLGSEFAPGARIMTWARVQGVPAGQVVVLSGLQMRTLRVVNSNGTVVLDNLTFSPPSGNIPNDAVISVGNCADVRLYECSADHDGSLTGSVEQHALELTGSTGEVVRSVLRGRDGDDTYFCGDDGGDAGSAVLVDGDSRGLVFLSAVRGGTGGNGPEHCGDFISSDGGDGGSGVLGYSGADVIVAGLPTNECLRGLGGWGTWNGSVGSNGWGVRVHGRSTLRYSGVAIETLGYPDEAQVTQPDPPDPCLELDGTHQPGQPMTFRVFGPPGAEGVLYLGRLPVLVEDPGQYMDQRTSRQRAYRLGSFPPSGVLEFVFPTPDWMARGFAFHAQAEALLDGGERRLTNSVPVVIRRLPER